jgi:hypothetical protein
MVESHYLIEKLQGLIRIRKARQRTRDLQTAIQRRIDEKRTARQGITKAERDRVHPGADEEEKRRKQEEEEDTAFAKEDAAELAGLAAALGYN